MNTKSTFFNIAITLFLASCLTSCFRKEEEVDPIKKEFKKRLDRAERNMEARRFNKAIEDYEWLLKMDPDKPGVLYFELGKAYHGIGDFGSAEKAYKKAYEVPPRLFSLLKNLASLYSDDKKFDSAEKLFKFLMRKFPENEKNKFDLSGVYLRAGRLVDGFFIYECRKIAETTYALLPNIPVLKSNDIKGKRIVVITEQGFGDVFQFIRYAKKIKNRGAKVIVLLHNKIVKKIISLCPFVDEVITVGGKCVADYKIALMSLPFYFETDVETIPQGVPYLYTEKSLEVELKEKLNKKTFNIGLCWHGLADHEEKDNRTGEEFFVRCYRSVDLKLLEPLLKTKGVNFYSLQMEYQNPITKVGDGVIHGFGPDFDRKHGAFMDTAAVMKNLDLVITIDTSIAHLAGGLGVPTWTMLKYESEWRWLTDRDDSPWYPTMRLFRQEKPTGWEPVIQNVKVALEKLVKERETSKK